MWINPPIDLNPKYYLHINHSFHNKNTEFLEKNWLPIMAMCTYDMHAFICSSKQLVYWAKSFLMWVSCLESGHFLSMWHHHTHYEHNVYDQSWGRICHPTSPNMIGFSNVLSFVLSSSFHAMALTTLLWSTPFTIVPIIH